MYPFVYSSNDRSDLGRLVDRHYPDPQGMVETLGQALRDRTADADLQSAVEHQRRHQRPVRLHRTRTSEGTQTPVETLQHASGTCRDFALLFIEAVRSLGFGARFVTGYLYDPALDGGQAMQGAGATHAWADVYLPGAGWVEYDPTNGLIAGENLIRVAVTRDPSQAIPISGTFNGTQGQFLGMTVDVTVHASSKPWDDGQRAAERAA